VGPGLARPLRGALIQKPAATAIVLLALGCASPALASDWPDWRGPARDGTSADANPPLRWSETENVRFKVELPGDGLSSPIVVGERVFALSVRPLDGAAQVANREAAQRVLDAGEWPPHVKPVAQQFVVSAHSTADGSLLWERVAREQVPHAGHYLDSAYAAASPVSDGERVYAHFGSNGTYAYELTGELVWERDLGDMETRMGHGEGSSPALHGERLYVNWDHEGDSFLVALDKRTGEDVWRVERPGEVTSWSTPLVVEAGEREQVIVSATGRSRGYDAATGEELWSLGGMTVNAIPTPVAGDGIVYLASGYRGSELQAVAFAKARGELEDSEALLWSRRRDTPYVPTPLLYGGRLYYLKHNRGILTSVDAHSGELFFTERLRELDTVYASPVAAAGRIYIFSREGEALVLRHGPEPEVLAHNRLEDGIDASPALVGADLYVRGRRFLYALREAEAPVAAGR
jgi:outer membrane protein assembly factor BamB